MKHRTEFEHWKRRETEINVELTKLEQTEKNGLSARKELISKKNAIAADINSYTKTLCPPNIASDFCLKINDTRYKSRTESSNYRLVLVGVVGIIVTALLLSGLMICYMSFTGSKSNLLTGAAVAGANDTVFISGKGHFKATENPKFILSLGGTGGV